MLAGNYHTNSAVQRMLNTVKYVLIKSYLNVGVGGIKGVLNYAGRL